MKFFLPLTALFCAGTVSGLPLTSTVNDVQIRSVDQSVDTIVERTNRGYSKSDDDDCDCDDENPVSRGVDQLLAGGDISVGFYTLLGDADFASNIIKLSANADFVGKVTKLCGSTEFIGKIDVLLGSDAFLDKCSGLVADGKFGAQLGLLLTNVDFLKKFSAGISADAFISLFGAHFGAGFDFGLKLSGLLGKGSFVRFLVSLCGKGAIGGKFGLLFGDALFISKLQGLLKLKAGFAAGLGGLLADASFMAHICGSLGFDANLTAKFVGLFAAKVNFALQLEGILGAGFKGKFGALLGAGSCTDLLVGFFGGASFHQICYGGFAGGAFFKAFAKLVIGTDFGVKFCGFLAPYFLGKISFVALIGQIFADKVFCVAALGLFGIKSALSIGLCAILGGAGIVGIVGKFVTGTLGAIIGGTFGFLGKVLSFAKGGHKTYW